VPAQADRRVQISPAALNGQEIDRRF
jgi:hypothetical protein